MISFDPPKSAKNAAERGLPFDLVAGFDWSTCLIGVSPRQEMTGTRFLAIGLIGRKIYVLVFMIEATGIRVISLRRASKRERQTWLANQTRT